LGCHGGCLRVHGEVGRDIILWTVAAYVAVAYLGHHTSYILVIMIAAKVAGRIWDCDLEKETRNMVFSKKCQQ
jgi:hypothetical protein